MLRTFPLYSCFADGEIEAQKRKDAKLPRDTEFIIGRAGMNCRIKTLSVMKKVIGSGGNYVKL